MFFFLGGGGDSRAMNSVKADVSRCMSSCLFRLGSTMPTVDKLKEVTLLSLIKMCEKHAGVSKS